MWLDQKEDEEILPHISFLKIANREGYNSTPKSAIERMIEGVFEDTDRPEVDVERRRIFRKFSPPDWMRKGFHDNFAALALQVASRETLRDHLRLAASFGYVYVTARPKRDPLSGHCKPCNTKKPPSHCQAEDNHWNALPSY